MNEKMTPLQAALDLTISVQMVANRQILQDFHGISDYRIYIENPYDVVRLWVNSRKEAEE
tara:strand:- start:4655 stop:4834 length:180 start_codon:yes stop_codon:yes gene_type:complete